MAAKVKALQGWCKVQSDGYRDVEVKNMTSSWKSGLAFCAIIHRYRPDLIDYDSLKKENVFENNKLAFEVAEKQLSIPALLDAEDMEAMSVPDKLCIVTYVSQYYNYFRNKEKLGGPGVKGKAAPKRQMIDSPSVGTPDNKKPHTQTNDGLLTVDSRGSPPVRRGSSMGDLCSICGAKVYLMERHIEGSKLFHRRCLRESQRSKRTINQNGAVSPKPKRAFKASDQTSPTNQNGHQKDQDSLPGLSPSSGKENEKPVVGDNRGYSKSPSGLLTKALGAPKPYSSGFQNGTDQSKVTEQSKWTSGSDSVLPPPSTGSAGPAKKYVPNKGATVETKQNFNHSSPKKNTDRPEPMNTSDRSGKKYDIVGALVNNYPSENGTAQAQVVTSKTFANSSSGQVAKVKPKPTDTPAETQVLHGLLKSLAGVRGPSKLTAAASDGDHLNDTNQTDWGHLKNGTSKAGAWKKDSDNQWSGQKASSPVSHKEEDDPVTARSRLKPVEKHSPFASKTSHMTQPNSTDTPKNVTSAVKPILKHTTDTPPVSDNTKLYKPKSILKSLDDSENENPTRSSRSVSPPKSILRRSEESGEKTAETVTTKKSSSPTRPILKHKEDPKDDKDQPKSILRSKPDDGTETVANRTILKKPLDSKVDEKEKSSPPGTKSILINSMDDLSKLTEKNESKKSWGSKLTNLFSRSPPDQKKTDLLSQVQLDSSDTEEPMEAQSGGNVSKPVPKPRKSILKASEADPAKPSHDEGKTGKSSWFTKVPTPEASSHSPASSTVFSTDVSSANRNNFNAFNVANSIDLAVEKKSPESEGMKSSKQTAGVKSAWQIEMEARQGIRQKGPKAGHSNFAAKVDAANKQKLKDVEQIHDDKNKSSVGVETTHVNSKPSWQAEAQNRQKNRNFVDPETEKANSPRGDRTNTHINKELEAGVSNSSSNKPAWQIEAERRQAERKGQYKDPEKFPHSKSEQMSFPNDGAKTKKLSSLNIDKPQLPRSPPPPRPVIPPNSHQVMPPPRPTTSPVLRTKTTTPPAPDFINSEMDIFGRTSKGEGVGKKVNRSPAFKISPESSPRAGSKEMEEKRKSSGSPDEVVAEWQKEAQKRQAARASGFVDPETKKVISPMKLVDQDSEDYVHVGTGSVVHGDKPTNKKKVVPDMRFSFTELEFSVDKSPEKKSSADHSGGGYDVPRLSPPERPPWVGKGFPGRPLPSPPPPPSGPEVVKREVTAEPQMALEAITTELLTIDVALQEKEERGKGLEQKIRMGSDEDMDEDDLMIQWFELVNEKNELVRRESELMYKQKQQELEDLHTEVEYEIRMLMNTPEHLKTPSDKVREETLLQELMETVSQRNCIVDNMEEDRKRYIEEDQEIAEVLATKDFSGSFSKSSPPLLPSTNTVATPKKDKKKKGKNGKKKKSAAKEENGTENGNRRRSWSTSDGKEFKEKKKKKQKERRLTGCIESTSWYD